MTVPRLTTALTGPLPDLERELIKATPAIEHWLRAQWREHAAPFYASVDLRNSGFKLAPSTPISFRAASTTSTPISIRCAYKRR